MGLNFCPTDHPDRFYLIKDITLFTRKLNFKTFFSEQETSDAGISPDLENYSIREFEALRDLTQLFNEGTGFEEHTNDLDSPNQDDKEFGQKTHLILGRSPLSFQLKLTLMSISLRDALSRILMKCGSIRVQTI